MPSPFPGMNPYLEGPRAWSDFHPRAIAALAEALGALIHPAYYVKIEANIYVRNAADPDAEDDLFIADAAVWTPPSGRPTGSAVAVADEVVTSVRVRLPQSRRRRASYLTVVARDGQRVVTVIELLSPANKRRGHDREVFLEKRRRLTLTDANYVELDLLRGFPRMPILDLPACEYYALVSRAADRPAAEVWPLRLRDPLPQVPIPLAPGESEPRLDLQAVLHRVYDGAGYGLYIYAHPPDPPLAPADAAWAAEILAARGG